MKRGRIFCLLLVLLLLSVTGCAGLPAEDIPEVETTQQQTQAAADAEVSQNETEDPVIPEVGEEYGWDSSAEYEYCIFCTEEGLYETLLEKRQTQVLFWYDQEEQELFASAPLPQTMSENWFKTGSVSLEDVNGDGSDDVLVSDLTAEGDQYIHCFLWDPETQALCQTPSTEYSRINIGTAQ